MNKFFACLIILSISGLSNARGGSPGGSSDDIENPKGYKKNGKGFGELHHSYVRCEGKKTTD
jgi:hypothetical protein